jgi:hypothetical protein
MNTETCCAPDYFKKVTFKDLFPEFIAGVPIKRRAWRGYWVYKYGKVEIHTKSGETINFLETQDIIFTLSGILMDDWEIATNENCDIPIK